MNEPDYAALRDASPLFLIGVPRSGTTILANLINSHSRILMTHETSVFLQLHEIITKNPLGGSAGHLFGKTYKELWSQHVLEHTKLLIESFYCKIAKQQSRGPLSFWGEKHPHFERCLPWLESLYPNSIYIYIVRDPRDTICSIATMNKWSIFDSAKEWHRISSIYEDFVQSIPSERLELLKYENLVYDYELAICELLECLGLELDDSSRSYIAEYKSKSSHLPGSTQNIDFAISSVARWQREMTFDEQNFVHSICKPLILKYGYD